MLLLAGGPVRGLPLVLAFAGASAVFWLVALAAWLVLRARGKVRG